MWFFSPHHAIIVFLGKNWEMEKYKGEENRLVLLLSKDETLLASQCISFQALLQLYLFAQTRDGNIQVLSYLLIFVLLCIVIS